MSFALPTLFSQGRVCKLAGSCFWLTWDLGPSTSGGAILAVRLSLVFAAAVCSIGSLGVGGR